jgi:histone arginine demethylase JMJD6
VGPGETLYIPFGIWHSAYSLTPTLSVAFDQLNSHNSIDFIKDVWKLKKDYGKLKAAYNVAHATMACMACKIGDSFGVKR